MTAEQLLRRALSCLEDSQREFQALIDMSCAVRLQVCAENAGLIDDIRAFLPPIETTVVPNDIELSRGKFNTPENLDLCIQRDLAVRGELTKIDRYLGTHVLKVGCLVKLRPGQRAVLRDTYELTPTSIVEIIEVELYPNSDIVRAVTIRSMNPELVRRHVLSMVRIDRFGEFLQRSADRETEQVNNGGATTKTTTKKSQTEREAELLAEYV
jgi:hypothetical protein